MLKEFWDNEDAIGVVEIILILVILIALVLIFKDKITAIVNNALSSIDEDSGEIIDWFKAYKKRKQYSFSGACFYGDYNAYYGGMFITLLSGGENQYQKRT